MKRNILVTMSLLLGLMMAPWPIGSAAPAPLDQVAVSAIQSVVKLQLAAFQEDDASRAFFLATSTARTRFSSAEDFLNLIREHYKPVYRHRTAIFSPPEVVDGNTIQLVRLTDPDSKVWLAFFLMKQESANNWKVDGCQLLETTVVAV